HRDIKPANILLSGDHALIADFGIARAVTEAGGSRLTQTGLSLGTPQYMSPEQATGERDLDARSDMYALGCVAYEMLAGEPPFTGPTTQAVVARLLAEPPERLGQRRTTVPLYVERAVHKALEKLPADRFATVEQFAAALECPSVVTPVSAQSEPPRRKWAVLARTVPWIVAVAAIGVAVWSQLGDSAPTLTTRVRVTLPGFPSGPEAVNDLDVSPDGRLLVYRSDDGSLLLQRLDELATSRLTDAGNPSAPRFSPDGQFVAYHDEGLHTMPVGGGPPIHLADSARRMLDWADDGFIYFTHLDGAVARVPAAGGPIEQLTTPDFSVEDSHQFPQALPGGKGVVFTIYRWPDLRSDIAVVDIETREVEVLFRGTYARYAPSGHLIYLRSDGAMLAVPFDERRLTVSGAPLSLTERVTGVFRLSRSGTLMYTVRTGQPRLVLVDRTGTQEVLAADAADARSPRVSPNGQQLAMQLQDLAGIDIWTYGLADRMLSRLTFAGDNIYPSWSPDGEFVLFAGGATGAPGGEWAFYRVRADGSQEPERVFERDGALVELVQTSDARRFVYREGDVGRGHDANIYAVEAEGPAAPWPLAATRYVECSPAVSPDARWLAYVSNESGRAEVYVRPISGAADRWQVSIGGGSEPVWAHSGRELFYISDDHLMTADVQSTPSFAVRGRRQIFPVGAYRANVSHAQYDVLPGDQRFVFVASGADETEVVLVMNLFGDLGD
ncbi:MAG: PD40 domain-containing protein, partial [Gemmatimonadetes bacterium]|nr:PD40 domain-containing protein [Gemmatimonadota bacterium]